MYSRNKAWRQALTWLRRAWPIVVVAAGLPVVASLPLAYTRHGAARGAVVGFAAASGVALAVGVTVLLSGAADRIMGVLGETFTADDLRALRREGWKVVHGLSLDEDWDIDHVAVGPGGVLVIETKWSANPWPLAGGGPAFMQKQLDRTRSQAKRGKRRVAELLEGSVDSDAINAVAVLWSADLTRPDPPTRKMADITAVSGSEFATWIRQQSVDVLTAGDIERVWETLTRAVEGHSHGDTVERRRTIAGLTWRYVGLPVLGALAALVPLTLASATHKDQTILVVIAIAVAVGGWAVRVAAIRTFAVGWLCVLIGTFLAGTAVLVGRALP